MPCRRSPFRKETDGENRCECWRRERLTLSAAALLSDIALHRVERERDILKKALAIFGRHE